MLVENKVQAYSVLMRTHFKSGIYCIHNTVNGKRYVGQSTHWKKRLAYHRTALKSGHHHNEHLQAAWKNYGVHAFEWTLLEETSIPMLDIRECAWIEYYDSIHSNKGYNIESGGHILKRLSEKTKKKMSAARKGKPSGREGTTLTKEHKRKLSIALEGRQFTKEAKKKMSMAFKKSGRIPPSRKGQVVSKEARARMTKAALNRRRNK